MMNKSYLTLSLLLLIFTSINAYPTQVESWQQLTPEMQILLGEYKNEWKNIPGAQRKRLINRGKSWLSHSEQQRNKLWSRYQRWQNMSQSQRLNMKESYTRYQKLSKTERHKLMKSQKGFTQLNKEKQQIMMQRFSDFQQRGGQMMPMTNRQPPSSVDVVNNMPSNVNFGTIPTEGIPQNRFDGGGMTGGGMTGGGMTGGGMTGGGPP